MDTTTKFEIIPLSGAGNLSFGMTPIQVAQVLGAPDQASTNHLKQRTEFRSFMNVAYTPDQQEKLCHIGFGRQMEDITLKGINFFKSEPTEVLKKLMSIDGTPFLYMGFIVFLNLGITLTGFHDNDLSQKAITLFEQGAWDKRIEKMKEFRLSE